MNDTEPSPEVAYVYEKPGASTSGLYLTRLMLTKLEHPVPLSFATLEDVCAYAREQGWKLAPLPDDEEWQSCRDLSDAAWVTIRRLMAK